MAGDEALKKENFEHALELYHLSKVRGGGEGEGVWLISNGVRGYLLYREGQQYNYSSLLYIMNKQKFKLKL